jgi:NADPH:quinone reductase-like Zn-dependent oxidoreductase
VPASSSAGPASARPVDLVPIDGDDQVRAGREVTVDRGGPDTGLGRDVTDRRVLGAGIRSGVIKPIVDKVFGFDEVVEAHRHLEDGQRLGKVVVTV